MSYSIHGDELSGVDAALWVAYHLVAATDSPTRTIRESVLTLIDPSQNPDGRERYLSQIFAYNGYVPSTNGDDMQHSGFWPWGRGNHYLFDMNRDWLPLAHPESQHRVQTILAWNPQLEVDAHEMGAHSTFLFSPAREPINANVTPTIHRWWDVFAADQGSAFDRRGWSYTTGDWHEEWYPGYGSSWSLFTGAVGILYEQAGVSGSAVRRYDRTVLTYPQAVAQQAVSSLANLQTAALHRRDLLSDYADFHRDGITGAHEGLRGAYILAAGENAGRDHRFLETIRRHGLRVTRATGAFTTQVRTGHGDVMRRNFPAGSYVIPLRQPRGLMVRALLDFDPHLSPEFLQEERRELEKGEETRLYEVSGWSLALAYDLDISYSASDLSVASEPVDVVEPLRPGQVINPQARFGYLLPTVDDRSMSALVRMLEAGLSVRAAEKPLVHENVPYAAGTLLLRRSENPDDLPDRLIDIARATGVTMIGTATNFSSDGPDLGSDYFALLEPPRVGIFFGPGADFTSCGSLWYLLDYDLRLRHSILDIDGLAWQNLASYNVLILPSTWDGADALKTRIGDRGLSQLKDWVRAGGTLIAVGSSAFFCADSTSGLSAARERGDVLATLDDYERDYREYKAAQIATVDTNAVWKGPAADTLTEKAESAGGQKDDLDELKRNDRWARRFHPRGVIMRLDCDPDQWLTFGTGGRASAIIYSGDALMAKSPVQVAARLAEAGDMRLSGLLWPEARDRWATAAYATRERMGNGQVILFADEPYFRAYFHGTKRLFVNAVILGPGIGASHPVPW